MNCKYCDIADRRYINLNEESAEYSGIELAISNFQCMLRVTTDDTPAIHRVWVAINNCPMCGRKLREES